MYKSFGAETEFFFSAPVFYFRFPAQGFRFRLEALKIRKLDRAAGAGVFRAFAAVVRPETLFEVVRPAGIERAVRTAEDINVVHPRLISLMLFSSFALVPMISCPQPRQRSFRSAPILVTSHSLLPQGWFFFIINLSPI